MHQQLLEQRRRTPGLFEDGERNVDLDAANAATTDIVRVGRNVTHDLVALIDRCPARHHDAPPIITTHRPSSRRPVITTHRPSS